MLILGRIFKTLFRFNLLLVLVWIISFIIGKVLGLEFSRGKHADIYFAIAIIGIPALVLTYSLRNIYEFPKWYYLLARLFIGLFGFSICLYVFAMASLFNICAWTTDAILFVNKNNNNIQIAERSYGCGATDSTPAIRKTFKIVNFGSFLIRVTEVEIPKLKTDDWIPINGR